MIRRTFLFSAGFLLGPILAPAQDEAGVPPDADLVAYIQEQELDFHATPTPGEWMAYNRRQGLIGTVRNEGFSIAGPIPEPDRMERIQIEGMGRTGSAFQPWYCLGSQVAARELKWLGKGMTVQYTHSGEGLRQNFIIEARPEGLGEVGVVLKLSGDLQAEQIATDRVRFVDENAQERFSYHDLHAWDARGAILTARMELSDDELTILVNDADAEYPITIDPISTSPNTLLTGTTIGMEFGIAVATAGDLNGDGFSDVVVGAWHASLGESNEGAAYVYYGSVTGISTTPSITLQGDQIGAQMGNAVSTAGDVNGDGYSDLLVGARTWESSAGDVSEGAVFVYHGSATGITTTPAIILQPNHSLDNFGSNVACAGDINNDGYSDIIVGAYLAEYPSLEEGQAFVFTGSASGLTNTYVHRLERNQGSAHFARSVNSAGDINGDGYSDVVVGASNYISGGVDQGAAFVWYGGPSVLGAGLNPAPSLTLLGSGQMQANYGWWAATAGDVNGDGYSDLAVAAYKDDSGGQTDEGMVYVYHGSAAGLITVPATTLQSNQVDGWMGRCLNAAGDVNGDGYSDLLVGAPQYTNGQSLEGVGFLFLGTATGLPTFASIIFELNQNGANVGESVCTAGDVNGDGYSDMIIGARIYGSAGGAAIFHGGPYTVSTTASRSWFGGAASANLGSAVANAGDVNGDGYADALFGAPGASNGQAGEGLAYLYTGSSAGLGTLPSVTLEANNAGAQYGASVATAGDVNGDGYADVIVGAPLSGGNGAAYLYLGGAGGLSSSPALTLAGTAGSQFGASVATAGDINSDGYADVLVGAPVLGTAYLYLGSMAGLIAAPANTLSEPPAAGLFGCSVATAGDVNGDGYSDIIIGARALTNGQATEGLAFVYHGSALGLVTPWNTRLEMNLTNASFGQSVAGAGDVNGDGYYEVIVGAELWESGQADEGGAFVFYGSPTGTLTAGATTIQRNIANGRLGRSVAEAGDINGDGYADVVVGAPLYETGEADEGFIYVFRGAAAGLVTATFDLIQPNVTNYQLGHSVSGGGDVDGDGYSDVLGGAPQANPVSAAEGGAYWFRGNQALSLNRLTRQYDADLVSPLSTNGNDWTVPGFFGIGHRARSPIHRCELRLRWEVVSEGQPFSGNPITNSVQSTAISASWTNAPVNGQEIKQLVLENPIRLRYRWRVRVEYPTEKMIDGQRFSRWFYGFASGLGDIGVLPIELLSFTGREEGEMNALFWTTATEHNSDHFAVERSANAVTFTSIGTINAAGESLGTIDYTFLDREPLPGLSYYRLRMVDQDGSLEFSDAIAIERISVGAVIFPNPAHDTFSLVLPENTSARKAVVIDAVGRCQRIVPLGTEVRTVHIGLEGLAPGAYTLLLLNVSDDPGGHLPFVIR